MIPTDKVNKSKADYSNRSSIHSFEKPFERSRSAALARKPGNVVPLDRPAHEGGGAEVMSKANDPAAHPPPALKFMGNDKTPVQSDQIRPEPIRPSGNTGELSLPGSERLRTEVITKAREAEARAREAEERYKQAEAGFKQEQALRLLAEQRVEEIRDEYNRQRAAAQAADFSRLELELILEDAEARIKQEAEARAMAEAALAQAKAEAGIEAQSAALALEESEARIAELGAATRAAEERAAAAEEVARKMESLMREAEAQTKNSEEKRRALETRIRNEIETRKAAEQKVQSLEREFKSDIEQEWAKFEADIELAEAAIKAREEAIAKASADQVRQELEEVIRRLLAQADAERQARIATEQARGKAEAKARAEAEARASAERKLIEAEANAVEEKIRINDEAERRIAETEAAMEAALIDAHVAKAETERKFAEAGGAAPEAIATSSDGAARKLAEAESKARKAETKLRVTKDKLLRAEAELEKFKHRLEAETSKEKSDQPIAPGQSPAPSGLPTELSISDNSEVGERLALPALKAQIKLVGYGAVIALLFVALTLGRMTAHRFALALVSLIVTVLTLMNQFRRTIKLGA